MGIYITRPTSEHHFRGALTWMLSKWPKIVQSHWQPIDPQPWSDPRDGGSWA